MSNINDNGGVIGAFDPTSSASMTGSSILCLGMSFLVASAYVFGRFRNRKGSGMYQMSMVSYVLALLIIGAGLYILLMYD